MILISALIFQRAGKITHRLDEYIASFRKIEALEIPTVLFLDEKLSPFAAAPHVTLIWTSIEKLETFALIGERNLPSVRNLTKDTLDYMIIMNAKSEFVKKALEITGARWASWIDFGICIVLKNPEVSLKHLKLADRCTAGAVTIPGCAKWNKQTDYLHCVSWRFCGGFFTGDREVLLRLRQTHEEVIRSIAPAISWEVNLLACCEKNFGFPFLLYSADHNDSILAFPAPS